jgi:cystathionine beta-lyase/cystathionine gamma-synthase
MDPKAYDPDQIEHRYIRIYVGLEEPEHLIADLDQALEGL